MWRYAARGLPLAELAAGTVLVALLVLVPAHWPQLWRGVALAVAGLVAVAAWSADEPAASVVDATPRALRWRTVARLPGILPAAGVWGWFAWQVHGPGSGSPGAGHLAGLLVLGAAALALGLAAAVLLRRTGRATPGPAAASTLGCLVPALGAWPQRFPVYPEQVAADWAWALHFWLAVGLAAAAVLAWAVGESRSAVYLRDGEPLLTHVRHRRPVSGRASPGGMG